MTVCIQIIWFRHQGSLGDRISVVLGVAKFLEHKPVVDIKSILDTRLFLSKDLKQTCIILNVCSQSQLLIRAYLMQLSVRSLTFQAYIPTRTIGPTRFKRRLGTNHLHNDYLFFIEQRNITDLAYSVSKLFNPCNAHVRSQTQSPVSDNPFSRRLQVFV